MIKTFNHLLDVSRYFICFEFGISVIGIYLRFVFWCLEFS